MKKFAITLLVLVSIALPVFAAAMNGCIDLDGSKAAEKAALLEAWNAEQAKAPVAKVEIGEVTVETPKVETLEEVQVVGTVAKAPRKTVKQVCRIETLSSGGEVKFCASQAFIDSLGSDQG